MQRCQLKISLVMIWLGTTLFRRLASGGWGSGGWGSPWNGGWRWGAAILTWLSTGRPSWRGLVVMPSSRFALGLNGSSLLLAAVDIRDSWRVER